MIIDGQLVGNKWLITVKMVDDHNLVGVLVDYLLALDNIEASFEKKL